MDDDITLLMDTDMSGMDTNEIEEQNKTHHMIIRNNIDINWTVQ